MTVLHSKGYTRPYERVGSVVDGFLHDEFSIRDVARGVPDIPLSALQQILWRKMKQGVLRHVRKGHFRRITRQFTKKLPNGFIADVVWTVLIADPRRRPMFFEDIVEGVRPLLDRPVANLHARISGVLGLWHHGGVLRRAGIRKQHRYRVPDGITQRPPLRPSHRIYHNPPTP